MAGGRINNGEDQRSWFRKRIEQIDRGFRWIRLKYTRSFRLLNRIRLPGFRGAGLYDVLNFFFNALGNRHFTLYGAAMAFQFFFAVFPGLIFIFSLVPYIPIDGLQEQVEIALATVVPGDALKMVNSIVGEVFSGRQVGLLSINLFLTLYGSLNGIRAMMFAFSKRDTAIFHQRSFLWSYFVAFVIFILLLVMFLATLISTVLSEQFFSHLAERGILTDRVSIFFLKATNIFGILLLLFAGISIIFYLAPETKSRWSLISPGGILTGILFMVAVWLFKSVIVEFVNYNRFYGSLSAVMLLMFWFYWVSLILLIGFELNTAIDVARTRRKGGEEIVLIPGADVPGK